jgi:hypothetical protein
VASRSSGSPAADKAYSRSSLSKIQAVPPLPIPRIPNPRSRRFVQKNNRFLDGVTGRQRTMVAAVAVPQSDEVRNGVRLGLLQASSRDDHGVLCRYRCVIGKCEPVRRRRDRADYARGQGCERARGPDRMVCRFRACRGGGSGWKPARCRNGCMRACRR